MQKPEGSGGKKRTRFLGEGRVGPGKLGWRGRGGRQQEVREGLVDLVRTQLDLNETEVSVEGLKQRSDVI